MLDGCYLKREELIEPEPLHNLRIAGAESLISSEHAMPSTVGRPAGTGRSSATGRDFGNLPAVDGKRYSVNSRSHIRNIPVMNSIPDIRSSISWVAAIVSVVGITAVCMRVFETDEARAKSAERKRGKELRSLANKISGYAQEVHQRYPTGDVVVSVRDLAEQIGKRPDAVAKALNLLLREQKVQQASLRGYWKLNQ